MSLATLPGPDREPSPRLTVNLGSNNPFRNRTSSPSSPGLASPGTRPERPLSTNPFLDDPEPFSPQSAPSGEMASPVKSPVDPELSGHATELFENLTLNHPRPKTGGGGGGGGRRPAPPRPENIPPSVSRESKPPPSSSHRRQLSTEDPQPRSNHRSREKPLVDVSADAQAGGPKPRPQRRQRPRRNSDSSLMERPSKPLAPEDEKRRRERRHRDRESKAKDGKSRSKRGPSRRLDLIDKLDVTGVYGPSLIHHDGPFDACNPHRNRRGQRSAPMQAFPKDSRNMALGGAGPNKKTFDYNQYHGRGAEGYSDFSGGGSAAAAAGGGGGGGGTQAETGGIKSTEGVNFDPSAKLEIIHGSESLGLGTSTFLEGTPASRTAIQRRVSENETQILQNGAGAAGGLQRKKSLAQKIRGVGNRSGSGNRVTSPDEAGQPRRPSTSKRPATRNPFFQQDYDDAYDRKGARIQEAAVDDPQDDNGPEASRPRATSTPMSSRGLERRVTTGEIGEDGCGGGTPTGEDAKASGGNAGGGGGFINRVKSLRRGRPDRKSMAPPKNGGSHEV